MFNKGLLIYDPDTPESRLVDNLLLFFQLRLYEDFQF